MLAPGNNDTLLIRSVVSSIPDSQGCNETSRVPLHTETVSRDLRTARLATITCVKPYSVVADSIQTCPYLPGLFDTTDSLNLHT